MKSIRKVTLIALSVLGMSVVPGLAGAYGLSGIGGKAGIINPEDRDGTALLGVHFEFARAGTRLHLLPNLMFWSSDGTTDINPNFDFYYHFGQEGVITPYLGAGLGLHMRDESGRRDDETDLGVNFFGGMRFPARGSHFFVEGRHTASDLSQTSILGGVTFHIGR